MRIDWLNKLAYLLQTLAFCLMVATVQYAIQPERSYEMPVVYSLCIGTTIWALIDFGRHAFPSSAETGWPAGLPGWLLPLSGIVAGFLLGTAAFLPVAEAPALDPVDRRHEADALRQQPVVHLRPRAFDIVLRPGQ